MVSATMTASPDKIQLMLEQWRQDLQESHFFSAPNSMLVLSQSKASRVKDEHWWIGRVAIRLAALGWQLKQIAALYEKPTHWIWNRVRTVRKAEGRVKRRGRVKPRRTSPNG